MVETKKQSDLKLYYIHGYLSSPISTKGVLFKEKLNAKPINYRDCEPEDLIISDCVKRINETIKDDDNITLIGSSLGGLLAAKTALINTSVKRIILLNPAIIPPSFDIKKIQDMSLRILSEMQDPKLFKQEISSEIIIILGTEDETVPNSWGVLFASVQEATVKFLHDDHSFSYKINQLPKIIGKYLNKSIN
jgi:predicted esterase YcpF (UPF0227 family)